ncbi:MAG TPA: MFS transporter [Xanthobacteraceae bacterium]|jgi:MFS family permease
MSTLAIASPPNESPSNALPPSSKPSLREVWLVTIGHSLTHWYPATFYLLLPLIGNELGLSFGQIGAILTCQATAGALSNVPGGMLVDSVDRKGLLMALSLFWVGAPYLLMGFSHQYWMLLCCAALVGMGNNLWHPTAIPLLARRFPERRGLVVSIHGMGGNVGDAVAPLVVGAMLSILSWRSVMVLNVIPGVLMSCVILLSLGRMQFHSRPAGASGTGAVGQRLRDFRQLLGNRTLLMLSAGGGFRAMTQSTLLTFLPVFLAREMGFSSILIGGCMFGMQVAGFTAAPIAGHLSDKMGRRRIIMSSMATSGVILFFMAFAGHSPAFVFLVAFLGFFLFAIRSVMQAWLLDSTPPSMGGTSIGIMFGTQAVGAAIGPITGGILADNFGLIATFYFLAFTIVVANMFIFFTPAPSEQPRWAPSAAE